MAPPTGSGRRRSGAAAPLRRSRPPQKPRVRVRVKVRLRVRVREAEVRVAHEEARDH